jgi:hypothetical protein
MPLKGLHNSGVEFFLHLVFWICILEIMGVSHPHIPTPMSCTSTQRGGEQRIMHVLHIILNVSKSIQCQRYSRIYIPII